jgi:ParB-like chromosome segregation protein Spo0J
MDIENRLRHPLSPYERGVGYRAWIRDGYFRTQEEIAKKLGISKARMSRLMKCAELPPPIVSLFADPREIRESWGVTLAQRCEDPATRKRMIAAAQAAIRAETVRSLKPSEVFNRLIRTGSQRKQARPRRDDVVRSQEGRPLFRVSYRNVDVHIVLPATNATSEAIGKVTTFLRELLDSGPNLNRRDDSRGEKEHLRPAETVTNLWPGRKRLAPRAVPRASVATSR